jgi:putative peptidoglycan lipid II flippase
MTVRSGPVGRRFGRLLAAGTVVAATLAFGGRAAAASGAVVDQTTPAPGYGVSLVSQTTWVGGGGTANPDLRLGVHVTAANPASTLLQVSVYARLVSRSDFAATLQGRVHTLRHAFDQVPLSTIPTDGAGTYQLDIPVNPLVEKPGVGLLSVRDPGVYPVQVVLLDRSGHSLAELTTHLLFTGKGPLGQTALGVALVVPVHAPPALAADGRPTRLSPAASASVAALTGLVASHAGVPVTLDPTPQTLEALAGGSEADKATLTTLDHLAGADQVLTGPYVPVNVAVMNSVGLDGELSDQIARGNVATAAAVHVAPAPDTWAEQGSLSPGGIDDLINRGVTRVLVDGGALSALPADLSTLTLAQPFELAGRDGRRVAAVSTDPGLEADFSSGPDQVLAAHQLLADLTVIQQERPTLSRGVAITVPESWPVDPTFVTTVLDGLQTSPMLAPETLGHLFDTVTPIQERATTLVRPLADQQPEAPVVTDAAAIRSARVMLTGLASFATADPGVPEDLGRLLLIAESADLADRQRPAELADLVGLIARDRSLIHLPASQSITLTARTGSIPITVASTAPYPARIRIRLSSPKLAFHGIEVVGGACLPGGTAETCVLDLHTQNTTLKVPVEARTAGVYPLKIELLSPDGGLVLASAQYTVRSTAASGVGIFLSVGAALLLVVWWARDLRHGRRARQLVPTTSPPPPGGEDGGGGWDGVEDGGGSELAGVPAGRAPPPPRPAGSLPQDAVSAAAAPRRVVLPPATPPVAGFDRITEPIPAVGSAAGPQPPPVAVTSVAGPARVSSALAAPAVVGSPVEAARVETQSPSSQPSQPSQPSPDGPTAAQLPVPPPRRPGAPSTRAGTGDELSRSFNRNTMAVAGGTLLSRLTGFGRVLALVWALHVTRLGDVFNIANTVPNILYDLVLGGILSATLVPVFVDYLGRDNEEDNWRALSAVCTAIFATLVVVSAVFWLLVPAIIHFYLILNHSPGAADERAIGVTLLQLFVPQLFLLGGIAVTTALLNARRHFATPAFSPVANNLVAIGAIVATRLVASSLGLASFRHDRAALLILGLGTTAGYLVQLLFQLPPIVRGRYRLRPVWDLRHPAVRTVLRLSLWTFGAVLANQVAFNLVLVLAGRKSGDVVVFTTAYQFFQLPYAIFAVSIAAVITPDLSERWSKGDVAGFRRQMASGLRLTVAVVVPAAVGYVILAHPLLTLIFHHGSFSSADAHRIGTVVAFFAAGLPGFSVFLLLMRAYQSMQDTRSMFWLYVVENGATVVLAVVLYPAIGVGGLALGWVSAYTIGSVVAYLHLRTRTRGLEGRRTATTLTRVAVATGVMTAVVLVVHLIVGGATDARLLVQVVTGVAVGAVVYLATCHVLGVPELDALLGRRATSRGAHAAGRRL